MQGKNLSLSNYINIIIGYSEILTVKKIIFNFCIFNNTDFYVLLDLK